MVANSTTLEALKDASGSIVCGVPSMSAASTTMSVANTSGFRAGEILKTKKVSDTGFTVEYMLITGSLRYSASGSSYSESIRLAEGVLFVPEMLMAANAMKAGMEILGFNRGV